MDPHWGTIADWRAAIAEIHSRGMYFMADFTVGTMADLIGFDGYDILQPFVFSALTCRGSTP
jgi:alpha-1,3-glucan synthase